MLRVTRSKSSSRSSTISSQCMWTIVDRLQCNQTRKSTKANYKQIWQQFNKFLVRLDHRPRLWEDRTILFCADLIDRGVKSSTVHCYVSAIKHLLKMDNYWWDENFALIGSLTKACRLTNDTVHHRFPIHIGLLEVILFELKRLFHHKPYVQIMYQTIFCVSYYGLLCMSEVVNQQSESSSKHAIKAASVHMSVNKEKILLILYTSKTHSKESRPQQIKIMANAAIREQYRGKRHFCPFVLLRNYLQIQGGYDSPDEQLFIFQENKVDVKQCHIRSVLRICFQRLGLDPSVYGFHSLRIGQSSDMAKAGYSIEEVKRLGRWKSNAIYKYIRD